MNNGHLAALPEGHQGRQGRVETEFSVQVQDPRVLARLLQSDGRAGYLVKGIGKGNHDIQPIGGPTLEKDDQCFVLAGRGIGGGPKPGRHGVDRQTGGSQAA
jgi:hypothetical protein